jgi:hypothetical protein
MVFRRAPSAPTLQSPSPRMRRARASSPSAPHLTKDTAIDSVVIDHQHAQTLELARICVSCGRYQSGHDG